MIPVINFNKEDAEKEVRGMLIEAIKEELRPFYVARAILGNLAFSLLIGALSGGIFYAFSTLVGIIWEQPCSHLNAALTLGAVVAAFILLLFISDIHDEIKGYQRWVRKRDESSLDELIHCCRCLYGDCEYAWNDAYHNFYLLCKLIENNILSATLINNNAMTFELEGEDHLVFEWTVVIDKTLLSTVAEHDTLSWENGKIIYTKTYKKGE